MRYVGTGALTKVVQLTKAALATKAGKAHASVTLTVAGWTGSTAPYEQTAPVAGVTADSDVIVSPAPDAHAAYTAASCRCAEQAAGSLTFVCEAKPDEALSVNVLILT